MLATVRVARVLLALAGLALIASCSFTRFGYNQADTVAVWVAHDYFDLEAGQKDELQKRFERFHGWHRHDQLPEYATFLRTAKGRLQQGVAQGDVVWFMDGMRSRVRTAAKQAAPEAAALLATLTPAQVENLKRRWEKDNKKYLRERKVNGTPDERAQAEAKRTIKHINDWLMPLNAEQEQRVLALCRELPGDMYQLHYADRLRRQKEFLEVLNHRTEDPQRFTQRVSDWIVNWERGRSADYQKRLDTWWQKRAEIMVQVDRSLTQQQRTAALQRVQGFIEDFNVLANRSASQRTASRD